MSRLVLEAVRKSYGGSEILSGASLMLRPGEHVGMVGRNGCGKTTLLRIIKGLEGMDSGSVAVQKGQSIGYLPQVHVVDRTGTLMDVMLSARPEVEELRRRLDFASREMERLAADGGTGYDRALSDYADLSDEYERSGGYTYENEITGALNGMGFTEPDRDRDASTLSGGERTRLELARLLVGRHGLLLLDEPTNHLDIRSIDWLEGFINRYEGTVLMVSHDRYFLDRTVNTIIDLTGGVSVTYPGNYTRYLELKAERYESDLKKYELAKARYDKEREYIERMRAGRYARQAKGREKRLTRFDMPDRPVSGAPAATIAFGDKVERSASEVVTLKDVTLRYGDRAVLDRISMTLRRGDRVAVIGPNGTGKSTLVRTLTGELAPDTGTVKVGGKVSTGYYAQGLENLDPDSTVLDEQWSVNPMETEQEVRSRLGRFLFSGDDVQKKVSNLSGGEKGRLAISKMAAGGANLLVLDEPTNHLDIESREALENALSDFGGTVVAVSHDRYFIDSFADRVFELVDGRLTEYHGNYSYYESKTKALQTDTPQTSGQDKLSSGREEHERRKRERAEENKARRQEEQKQKTIVGIEEEILGIEDRLVSLEAELSDPASYGRYGRLAEITRDYEELKNRREELYGILEKELA